jgi:arabinogalactan endo-1,4-beta-galactosidase
MVFLANDHIHTCLVMYDSTDPNSGNAWENQALFDYDDRALPAQEEFLHP